MLRWLVVVGCASIATACSTGPAPQAAPVSNSSPVQATSNPPRSPGLVYAEKACSACHAVVSGQTRSPDPKAPTFEAIANTPGMTTMALNVWLHSSLHRDMPYVRVEPDQLESLAEHLFSLRK